MVELVGKEHIAHPRWVSNLEWRLLATVATILVQGKAVGNVLLCTGCQAWSWVALGPEPSP